MTTRNSAYYAPLLLRVTLGSLIIAHLYWKFAILPGGINHWISSLAKRYAWYVP